MLNLQPNDISNLDLSTTEIESILDKFGATEQVISSILKKYKHKLSHLSFKRINNIINNLDLCEIDEKNICSNPVKRNFFKLFVEGRLSRLEIVYLIKNKYVSDNDLVKVFDSLVTISLMKDLIDVTLCWRQYLFNNVLKQYCSLYKITQKKIDDNLNSSLSLEKFKHIIYE